MFLDRDGTITDEVGYVNHPSRLRLLRGSADAIRMLNDRGVYAVVTTNQAGIARGYFTEDVLKATNERLLKLLARRCARLDGLYYCPHHPTVGPAEYRIDCNCRKPKPGMIESACRDLPIDLANSYMVGDRISDSTFGHRLGLRTVMVMTGYGRGEFKYQRESWTDAPDHFAPDLRRAVEWIMQDLENRGVLTDK